MPRRFGRHAAPWPDLRDRVLAAATQYPATGFTVSGHDDVPHVAWTDGPGPETFLDRVGDLTGWTAVAGPPGGDVSVEGPVLHVDRSLSERALAVTVVRFYASRGRHWGPGEPAAEQEAWRALCGIDDPERSGYPIADRIADLLLDAPDPPGTAPAAGRAAELSAKLAAVGYERLWAVAFSEVQ